MKVGRDIPPGWDYNPSTWPQRLPIIALAMMGGGIAIYLALWQYSVTGTVWEPLFGEGSRVILDSELSRVLSGILPLTDAALGALAYLADAVFGAVGGRDRWRRMPWVVLVFAVLVGPLGVVSVGLVIAQPVLYDAWCTLCLASAVISVLMIGPAMDEAMASLQHLRRVQRSPRQSAWRAFWGLEPAATAG
jgi:uncharacterized membrane protein